MFVTEITEVMSGFKPKQQCNVKPQQAGFLPKSNRTVTVQQSIGRPVTGMLQQWCCFGRR